MATYNATFESYTDGQAITTAVVGADTAFTSVRDAALNGGGGTITATTTSPLKGSVSARLSPDAVTASLNTNVEWTLSGTSNQAVLRVYFTLAAKPSTTCHFVRFYRNGQALYTALAFDASAKFLVYDAANALKYTAPSALAVSTLYRLEVQVQNGTGATDSYTLAVYQGNSTSALFSTTITSNFGTGFFDRFQLGKLSTCLWGDIVIDDLTVLDGTLTPLGPTSGGVGAPVVTVPADHSRALTAGADTLTGSGAPASGGTITAYQWTLVSGPASAYSGDTTGTLTVQPPAAPGQQRWRLTATQTS